MYIQIYSNYKRPVNRHQNLYFQNNTVFVHLKSFFNVLSVCLVLCIVCLTKRIFRSYICSWRTRSFILLLCIFVLHNDQLIKWSMSFIKIVRSFSKFFFYLKRPPWPSGQSIVLKSLPVGVSLTLCLDLPGCERVCQIDSLILGTFLPTNMKLDEACKIVECDGKH
jgi:hypothetical protein